MSKTRIGLKLGSRNHRSMHAYRECVVKVGLIFALLLMAPTNILAWNSSGLNDLYNPSHGLDDYKKTHEWIVHQAMEYLKEYNYIPKGTWFNNDEFKELLQWGVAYADHTGRKISAGFGYSIDWDIDGFRHFYHPASVWVTLLEGDWGDTDFAHVGELTAPEYSKQLYKRAVEFWPNGAPPLDLDTLTKVWRLGYTWDAPDETPYAGWAEGTDPRLITGGSRLDPPEWPPWVVGNQEAKETSAIFLGWALHMVQDMSVYHHTKNLHGIPHQDYEESVEHMIKDNEQEFSGELPIARGGEPFCVTYISCDESSSFYCEPEEVKYCYDLFPHYAFFNLDTFDIKKLANSVAYYAFKEAKAPPHHYTADVMTNYALASTMFKFKNEAYVKHCLDAAIKGSAAVIYKFISDVSQVELPQDKFEPNDTYFQKWRLNPGSYPNLAISDALDEDYYLIEMPYQGDLEIRIDYDNKLAEIGVQLDGPYQPYWPTATAQGKSFKLKGIAPGEYVLHLQPGILWDAPVNADVTTTYYNLHITVGEKRLDPDWLEENDTPETADERLCSSAGVSSPGLTIDDAGDDDYYLVEAAIGYRIDVGITFAPSEGELRLFLNNEEVKEEKEVYAHSVKLHPNSLIDRLNPAQGELRPLFNNTEAEKKQHNRLKLARDFLDAQRPSINKKALQEAQPSLSPSPTASELSKKTLSISRCSSGRDIIRITGQPNYYSINVTKTVDFDHCGLKFSPMDPKGISSFPKVLKERISRDLRRVDQVSKKGLSRKSGEPSEREGTIKPSPALDILKKSQSFLENRKVSRKATNSVKTESLGNQKVPPSKTIPPKPVLKVPPSTMIRPKPVAKVPPSTTIRPKPIAEVSPSKTIRPKPVLRSTVRMQRTYR